MHSIELTGNLTIQSIQEIQSKCQEMMNDWLESGVEIDASQVEVIDTAGIQLILSIKKSIDAAGQSFALKGNDILNPAIHRLGCTSILNPA